MPAGKPGTTRQDDSEAEAGVMEKWPPTLAVIGLTLRAWWDDWVNMVTLTLLWWLCWLTIVLGPPATFGLYHVANGLAYGQSMGPPGWWQGVRRYFWQSWLWFLANAVMLLVLAANYFFYAGLQMEWAGYLQALFVLLTLAWLALQFYTLPLFMEQDEKSLRQAWRNGALTILASPGHALVILSAAFLIAAFSIRTLAPLFLGVPCLLALLGCRSVRERLETFGLRYSEPNEEQRKRNDSAT